jgi:hypothetical protein
MKTGGTRSRGTSLTGSLLLSHSTRRRRPWWVYLSLTQFLRRMNVRIRCVQLRGSSEGWQRERAWLNMLKEPKIFLLSSDSMMTSSTLSSISLFRSKLKLENWHSQRISLTHLANLTSEWLLRRPQLRSGTSSVLSAPRSKKRASLHTWNTWLSMTSTPFKNHRLKTVCSNLILNIK